MRNAPSTPDDPARHSAAEGLLGSSGEPGAWLAALAEQGVQVWLAGDRLRCGGPEALLTEALFAQLRARRDELLPLLRAQATAAVQAGQTGQDPTQADAPRPVPRDGRPLPLSFAQQRLWFLEQMPQEAGVYNLPFALRIRGWLDVAALQAALNAVLARHEVLRTRYVRGDARDDANGVGADADTAPRQLVDPPTPLRLPCDDLRGQPQAGQALQQALAQEAAAPFDLATQGPLRARLWRLADDQHVLALTLHHIACDAWSLELLVAELARHWRAALVGELDTASPPPALQYADFAAWQRQRLQGDALAAQGAYWRGQLADAPAALGLATDRPRPRLQTHRGALQPLHLDAALTEGLRALGQRQGASLFMVLQTAYALLLARLTGQAEVLVGVPVANRPHAALEGLIGLFVNTLVLRTRVAPEQGFEALLAQVRQTTLQALAHQDLPFEQLIEQLQPERDLSRHPLFQAKFRLDNGAPPQAALPGLAIERLPQAAVQAKLDVSLDLYETAQGLVGAFEYNADLFEPATVARWAEAYAALLQAALARPQQAVATLPLLSAAGRQQVLVDWNQTRRPWQRDTCFHHLVEAAAATWPGNAALVFDGQPEATLDYATLNQRANQLAHWLRAHGVGPEVVVAIAMPRSVQMVVALLAVLKAGGAYLPLDADYPPERLAFMLQDARVPVLLSLSGVALPGLESLSPAPQRLDLDSAWPADAPTHNPAPLAGPQHLAYVIYTSGSTGRPKGVMVEHAGLVNLTEDKVRTCDVRPGDCVLQFFSFSFDASIPEIVMALATGARLLLAPGARLLPGPGLAALMARHAVSHVTMTPSALLALPEASPGALPALRMVLVGGEAPAPELMARWSREGRRFINAYGPTETTVNASMVVCGNGAPLEATLAPAANKQLYVLDAQLQPLPPGCVGELCIGGVGLARGYLGRPALTARQFVPNPFHQVTGDGDDETGATTTRPRLYRTGDLAVQGADGRIRVLGRIDQQVKVRGFRVELGDIEQALASHPAVAAAVVTALPDIDGGHRLAAWAVPQPGVEPPPVRALTRHLAERLPRFMLPGRLAWVAQLPLNANGKLDLPALIALDVPPQADAPAATAALSPTEATVAAAFAATLGLPRVGLDDDFFDLGGHSLLATRLVARLLDELGVEVTVIDLFEAATVHGLAQRITHKQQLAQLTQPGAPDSTRDNAPREEIEL